MSGSITSRMMRSGSSSRTAEIVWAPLETARTWNPANRRLVISRSRMFGSSSTTRMRGAVMPSLCRRNRCGVWISGDAAENPSVGVLPDLDAAAARRGRQDRRPFIAGGGREAPDELEVRSADEGGVPGREGVEGAVLEHEIGGCCVLRDVRSERVLHARRVAAQGERRLEVGTSGADRSAGGECPGVERIAHRHPSFVGLRRSGGEQLPGELVVAFRDGGGELGVGGTVELRWAPRARARAT